jgi:hypothetical protein
MKTNFFPLLALIVFAGMVMMQRCEYVPDDTPSGIDTTDTTGTTDTVVVDVPRDTLSVSYIPMLVPGNRWNILYRGVTSSYRTYITKIGQQTTINGMLYYQLLTSQDSLSAEWAPNGYAREDTAAQKVYYKPEDRPELLLYAFNVKPGDEFATFDIVNGQTITISVIAVDSMVIDYKWHHRLKILSSAEPNQYGPGFSKNHTWIEGIGNIVNWFEGNAAQTRDGVHVNLLCFSKSDALLYQDTTLSQECFVWMWK